MRKPNSLRIGAISEGTLRMEDLIPALLDTLSTISLSKQDRKSVTQLQKDWKHYTNRIDQLVDPDDALSDIYNELSDIADNYCPPFCYFGSTEGDGASIGVWPSNISSIVDDHEEVVLMSEYENRTPHGVWIHRHNHKRHVDFEHISYVLEINDHGNVTLYKRGRNGQLREVWSIV